MQQNFQTQKAHEGMHRNTRQTREKCEPKKNTNTRWRCSLEAQAQKSLNHCIPTLVNRKEKNASKIIGPKKHAKAYIET
jgi:hypothetical protein